MLRNRILKALFAAAALGGAFYLILNVRGDLGAERRFKFPAFLISHREDALNRAKSKRLNYMIPSFTTIAQHLYLKSDLPPLHDYKTYYETVASAYPQMAEAQAVLGNVYYYSKEENKAIASFQKAVELNPQLFGPYYNLGVIFYKLKQYETAAGYLSQAMAKNPLDTVTLIRQSRIYQQIFSGVAGNDNHAYDMKSDLQKSYQDTQELILLCYYFLQVEPPADSQRIKGLLNKNYQLRLF